MFRPHKPSLWLFTGKSLYTDSLLGFWTNGNNFRQALKQVLRPAFRTGIGIVTNSTNTPRYVLMTQMFVQYHIQLPESCHSPRLKSVFLFILSCGSHEADDRKIAALTIWLRTCLIGVEVQA